MIILVAVVAGTGTTRKGIWVFLLL